MSQTNELLSCFDGTVKFLKTSEDAREAVSCYASGKIQARCSIVNGFFSGLSGGWYENGNKSYEVQYLVGELNGLARYWHGNGMLSRRYLARNGNPTGIERQWDNTGKLISVKLHLWASWTTAKELLEYLEGLLLKEALTVEHILKVKNAELRRILIEDMGYERFVAQLDAQIIEQDGDRELLKVDFPNEESMCFVKVRCPSTGSYYMLRVPPTMKTAKEAVAWTFGFHEDTYKPEEET